MESLLQNIPEVLIYIDDILITGKNDEEHFKSLGQYWSESTMLECCWKRKISIHGEVCIIPQIYIINSQGLYQTYDKFDTIQEDPSTKHLTQLKLIWVFWHIKVDSCLISQWRWSEEELAFQESKKVLTSSNLLVYFDPSLPMILSCDPYMYRIGAILAHCMMDGSDKPTVYVSRTLQ